ncbi:WD repeat-containing protein 54-like [Homarus americanus]|uniref:WD repeat-containing protein 54-like n=1 Tax=Homarus americanus TaxID=6706 RepID=A0A8J5N1N4_HOMAM|nr:WD repeat-containing protein 54-like [Homarus americanus]
MYEREKTVLLKSSASLLPNNVCRVRMGGKMCAGVIHKEELNIVCPAVPEAEPRVVAAKVAPSATAGAVILQAAWVEVREQVFLVLATTQGALIFDWDGSVLLHAHLLPLTPLDTPFTFTKGIAALYTGYICVGVHTGEILVISVNEDGDMATVEKVRWHARPITALATHGQVLVSADDAGDMTIAQEDDGFTKLCSIDSYGIFNLQDGYIVAEVCAHVRSITGLDVARETGMLMTASEDTFVRVWQLNPDTNLPIEHKYSVSEENTALCGGVFTDDLGSGYVVTGYDRRELICYAM